MPNQYTGREMSGIVYSHDDYAVGSAPFTLAAGRAHRLASYMVVYGAWASIPFGMTFKPRLCRNASA